MTPTSEHLSLPGRTLLDRRRFLQSSATVLGAILDQPTAALIRDLKHRGLSKATSFTNSSASPHTESRIRNPCRKSAAAPA